VGAIRPVGDGPWQLVWRTADGTSDAVFDHVVIGSGFFAESF
jgi:hypothetical protein